MGDLGQQLLSAASSGDLLALQACLEAGAGPSARSALLTAPLHAAALNGHAGCVTALLAAGADANARTGDSYTPLHRAACHGCTACVVALLAAGASPSAGDRSLFTPVHLAAFYDQPPVLRQLLAADSAAALLRNRVGHTPLQLALKKACINAARCLLQLASQQPTDELLAAIEMMPRWWAVWAVTAPPLYTLVAASQPLTPAQWERVPTPCPGLGTALPAVLERSASEAALLVRHLPRADRKRLRSLACCLERGQRQGHLPPLPTDIVWHLLAWSAAGTAPTEAPAASPAATLPAARPAPPPRRSALSTFLHACRTAAARLLAP